jgi:hypothetical protein
MSTPVRFVAASNSDAKHGSLAPILPSTGFSISKRLTQPSPAQRPTSTTHKTITNFGDSAILIVATEDSTYDCTRLEDIKGRLFQPRYKAREIPSRRSSHLPDCFSHLVPAPFIRTQVVPRPNHSNYRSFAVVPEHAATREGGEKNLARRHARFVRGHTKAPARRHRCDETTIYSTSRAD